MLRRKLEIAVAPVYTALAAVGKVLAGSNIGLAAQDVYWEDSGAFTGEVSAAMLLALGLTTGLPSSGIDASPLPPPGGLGNSAADWARSGKACGSHDDTCDGRSGISGLASY